MTYKKDRFLDTNIDSVMFFGYFLKVMQILTKDQLIKQISDEDVEIPNERLLNSILIAFDFISENIKHLQTPYMCQFDYELFESMEEFMDHNQLKHNQINLPQDIDNITKFRYEMIAPLINIDHRTEDMVKRRSKLYGSSLSAIYRYLNRYDKEGIEGLKCLYSRRGRKKEFKGEIGKIVHKHVNYECKCCNYSSTVRNQYNMIKADCDNNGIAYPSFSTVYRRVGENLNTGVGK